MLTFWIIIFVLSVIVLVKGADWLLESSEKIGLSIGISPFVVGILIVGLGTSMPELVASLFAVWQGATEMVVANAVGSNITNILLVIGISSIVATKLAVTKNLIDLDLPLTAIATVALSFVVWDGQVIFKEALLLFVLFIIYFFYTVLHDSEKDGKERVPAIPDRTKRNKLIEFKKGIRFRKPKISPRDFLLFVMGIIGLFLGAKYVVQSAIEISSDLGIAVGVISLFAVALGTSLPELIVSVKAAWRHKPEVALGNIFGSNVFNALLVVGVPGLFKTLEVGDQTLFLGLPVMIGATILFIISGISKRIHVYEGAMFVVLYILFVGKLFGFM